jgi:O-methyltransferase
MRTANRVLHKFGLDLAPYRPHEHVFPPDFDQTIVETVRSVSPYTRTSPERIFALCEAVSYIAAGEVPGDIVECGVWRGGSMMAAARTLSRLGDRGRHLYLFDTFEGMTPPGEQDVSFEGARAADLLEASRKEDSYSLWCYSRLEEVKRVFDGIDYDGDQIHFVKGRVEETLPEHAPERIALLRLDTDWYESTRHELVHLFPRIVPGGVIIVDDYGHWRGARQAVDEYFQEQGIKLLLNRIDYTGRIGVVPEHR